MSYCKLNAGHDTLASHDKFTRLLETGLCIQERYQHYIINIVIWLKKDLSDIPYLVIGNYNKQSYLYKIPLYEINGIQIGCSEKSPAEIENNRLLGIFWSKKTIWLYFPTDTSAKVFRESFSNMLYFTRGELALWDYL
jgi:hypothetical protein